MKWKPIETAPRDGTVVLGYDPTWYDIATPMKYNATRGAFMFFHITTEEIKATHWMPMPKKPAGAICPADTWRSRGDTDVCVGTIQRALLCAGFDVKPDAVFGRETQQVVMHFQEVHGLTANGVVGPETWVALNRYLGGE